MVPGVKVLIRSCDGGNIETKELVGDVGVLHSFCDLTNMWRVDFLGLGYFWFKEKHLEAQNERNSS